MRAWVQWGSSRGHVAPASNRMRPIYRAFVSSTFEDLKDHRTQVIEALRRSSFFVDPMEDWTAAKDEPRELSLDRMRGCDLCVLLVAWRRGHIPKNQKHTRKNQKHIPKNEKLSITQLEYGAAVDHGIDVLVFMLHDEAAWPRKFDELEKDPKIGQWRKQLKETRTVSYFDNDPHSIKIDPALTRWVMDAQSEWMSIDRHRRMKMDFEQLERLLRTAPGVRNGDTDRVSEILRSLIREFQSIAPRTER